MNKRMDLIDLASTPDGQRDFVAHLNKLCDTLGVEHATYFAVNPISGKMHGFTTYPDEWKAHYVQHGLQQFDPTLRSAARSVAPVDWNRLNRPALRLHLDHSNRMGRPEAGNHRKPSEQCGAPA